MVNSKSNDNYLLKHKNIYLVQKSETLDRSLFKSDDVIFYLLQNPDIAGWYDATGSKKCQIDNHGSKTALGASPNLSLKSVFELRREK